MDSSRQPEAVLNIELHVGQLLRCIKEHFGLGPAGVFAVNVDDLLVVIETTSLYQGRGVRLDDGVEISLLTLAEFDFDEFENFVTTKPPTYEVVT